MFRPEDLYKTPNALAGHYSRFRVSERLLLTGHSHQAWPDCGFDGQQQAWQDAAEYVDDKWERAFEKTERVRLGYAKLLGDSTGHYTLASSTHDVVIRFLSALPLQARPRLVTTDGEYHTIRRQLDRLGEERIEIIRVAAHPAATVVERLAAVVDERTACVLVSSVFYQTGHIVPGLTSLLETCRRVGAELLIDAYHSVNVAPFAIDNEKLGEAFVVGGGYKYCQLGEGNCFLRSPADCTMRPVITGWFSEFGDLTSGDHGNEVTYGPGSDRFAGSTYDPTSHYRAAAVLDFFTEHALSTDLLREVSQHQIGVLAQAFDAIGAESRIITRNREVPLAGVGGFLALRSPVAAHLCDALHKRGVMTDFREDLLRFGPAPYLSDSQLSEAIDALREAIAERTSM